MKILNLALLLAVLISSQAYAQKVVHYKNCMIPHNNVSVKFHSPHHDHNNPGDDKISWTTGETFDIEVDSDIGIRTTTYHDKIPNDDGHTIGNKRRLNSGQWLTVYGIYDFDKTDRGFHTTRTAYEPSCIDLFEKGTDHAVIGINESVILGKEVYDTGSLAHTSTISEEERTDITHVAFYLPEGEYLHIAEIYLYDEDQNRIFMPFIWQSSNYHEDFGAELAIDLDTSTYNHTYNNQKGGEWIIVRNDFSRTIGRIVLANRENCCQERLDGVKIMLIKGNLDWVYE